MHGSGSPHAGRPGGRPPTHGLYSKVVRPEDIKTLEELRAQGFDITEELALAKLQVRRAVQYAEDESRTRCNGLRCPFGMLDERLELVGRLAARARQAYEGATVRVIDVAGVRQLASVIRRHVSDPALLGEIIADLENLGIEGEEKETEQDNAPTTAVH